MPQHPDAFSQFLANSLGVDVAPGVTTTVGQEELGGPMQFGKAARPPSNTDLGTPHVETNTVNTIPDSENPFTPSAATPTPVNAPVPGRKPQGLDVIAGRGNVGSGLPELPIGATPPPAPAPSPQAATANPASGVGTGIPQQLPDERSGLRRLVDPVGEGAVSLAQGGQIMGINVLEDILGAGNEFFLPNNQEGRDRSALIEVLAKQARDNVRNPMPQESLLELIKEKFGSSPEPNKTSTRFLGNQNGSSSVRRPGEDRVEVR